ncbi:ankyrin repeat domain-containing protein [Bacillus aquiflavi]|uniref:Ankyrin repeat domain-containing protein n=1 Tax=Bacillus aquiflavi TaxID=2672567 RepID=A0A6B3W0G8_9BACI|nr:ankyrin repeat domain-containing protein [Bacillus aquiflavi]MBA4538335.1 ankyrin repeat domain-containing protein [Bacillus aquiflavi]NEY82682.1 ankyrin repeat domain-containing protein [Bacillus aquiflavi]
MKIDLIAKLKNTEDFMDSFQDGDEKKLYDGKSLIFYSLSNIDLDSRYKISNFLLDKDVNVLCKNKENETVLHVLLGQIKNNIEETYKLCYRFIQKGVNINEKDSKGQVTLDYIIRMNKSDEELSKLYDLWFSQPNLDIISKDDSDCSPFDYAEKFPYRKDLLKRMEKYAKKRTS